MKDFLYMYGCTLRQIKLSEGQTVWVRVQDIIPKNKDWQDTIWRYSGLIKRINKGVPYQGSAWHKHEIHNETKRIQYRFDRFRKLYHSIKNDGFQFMKRQHIKLLNVSNIERKNPERGGRISYKYYRINGMKRVLICNFLNINRIPCKVYGVKL
jgi:hypothetical protein